MVENYSLISKEKADEIAAILNAESNTDGGDGWKHKAVHDPKGTGNSFIEVYDEQGILLGKL